MDLKTLYDSLIILKDIETEHINSYEPRYGVYGVINKKDLKKTIEGLNKINIPLDDIIKEVEERIKQGYTKVKFMKKHWEFFY